LLVYFLLIKKFDHTFSDFRNLGIKQLCLLCFQLLDKSKQWWKVRNSRGEEGYVPNNVFTLQNSKRAGRMTDRRMSCFHNRLWRLLSSQRSPNQQR
uniref:SH3 domain-containing protein n=1 Tax=Oryzias melastigma TaxID=30732 RepID=A0A3B3C5K3_ORYME